ncbi:MAG TPA: agmatinase [Bdellovibrionales bacterium]|nr:agmatinase [Bdellovibrionales bacterium]
MSIEYKPLSGREFPRFSGIKTFFRLPVVPIDADYDVGILGVPFDGGVSYRPGARFAPTKIREVSSLGRVFHMGRMESFIQKIKVADIGDCPTVPISLEKTYERIEEFFGKILAQNKRTIAVGGDHSTTLPILRQMRKKHGKPLAFVHFDAHLDTYPPAWDMDFHHGSFARHAVEEGLVDPKRYHMIGIRGPLTGADDLDFVKKHGVTVHTMDEIRDGGVKKLVQSLPDFGDHPTYISYDVDCLDPSCAPGTGTPVPGGLTTYEVQQILRGLKMRNLVGADIVEVSPPFDVSDITALAGLDAMFEFLGLYAQQAK